MQILHFCTNIIYISINYISITFDKLQGSSADEAILINVLIKADILSNRLTLIKLDDYINPKL